eukprot:sb/3473073/
MERLGVFISTSWTYFIVKDTPHQDFEFHNATAFDHIYTFMYSSGNLYSTALLYLMGFSRYRAIADPFDAVPYKEILSKVIGFGIATVVICLASAAVIVFIIAPDGAPCFQASYTAVVLLVADKEIQSEVRKMLASLKIWENTNEGGAVTVMETVLE